MSTDLAECRRLVREAQEDFAHDADRILAEMTVCIVTLSPALGEISPSDALEALREVAVKAIDRCLERRRG
jgi:hypothetical protein